MSSSPQKNKRPPVDDEKTIIGYVQNLSPTKKSRRGSSSFKYASFTLQTSKTESCEALIYSDQKRPLFEQSQQNRTPIKLKNYAFTEDKDKIVVNDITNVATPQQCEYAFQYAEITPKQPTQMSILDVLNEVKEWTTVTVTGKITKKPETRTVGKSKLRICEAVLADESAYITIDLWEDYIQKIEPGKVYIFRSVQLRIWAGKKKLSTTQKSSIEEQLDHQGMTITPNALDDDEEEDAIVNATITEFERIEKFEKFNRCSRCQKKIYQQTTTKVVKCITCGVIKVDSCGLGMSTTVAVKVETGDSITLKMGNETLSKILQHEVIHMDEQTLGEELLFKENVTITYSPHNMLVKDIYV